MRRAALTQHERISSYLLVKGSRDVGFGRHPILVGIATNETTCFSAKIGRFGNELSALIAHVEHLKEKQSKRGG